MLLSDLLFGPAQVMPGSSLDDDALVLAASEEFANARFCIVRNWMLFDVMLSDNDERSMNARGLQSTVPYAQTMVSDGESPNRRPQAMLSGYQLGLHGCFFETRSMLYILAGHGARKYASKPAISALAILCDTVRWEDHEQRAIADFA